METGRRAASTFALLLFFASSCASLVGVEDVDLGDTSVGAGGAAGGIGGSALSGAAGTIANGGVGGAAKAGASGGPSGGLGGVESGGHAGKGGVSSAGSADVGGASLGGAAGQAGAASGASGTSGGSGASGATAGVGGMAASGAGGVGGGGPACGNGTLDPGESCDGTSGLPSCLALFGADATGTTSCSSLCSINTSLCVASSICGDTSGLEQGAGWPMLGRCPTRTNRGNRPGPRKASITWTYDTKSQFGFSRPVVADDGTIYVGALDGKMRAIHPDGTLAATYQTGDLIHSTPAILQNHDIVFGSLDGTVIRLHHDLTKAWTYDVGSPVWDPPIVRGDGVIFVGTLDGRMLALNGDGTLAWSYQVTDSTIAVDSGSLAPDGTLYAAGEDGAFAAITSAGALAWSFDSAVNPTASSSMIGADGTVFWADWTPHVYAFSPSGTTRWTVHLTNRESIGALAGDGTVYVAGGGVRVFHPSDGSVAWLFVADDYTSGMILDSEAVVYFGTGGNDRHVYAFGPDGTQMWRSEDLGVGLQGCGSIGPNGALYVTTSDGRLVAFGAE